MKIILIGFMGAGKTSVGQHLAKQTGLPMIDTDQYIESLEGRSIPDIFKESGEAYFRSLESSIVDKLAYFPEAIIATGGGLPCHSDNISKLKLQGKSFYLSVPPSILADRLLAHTFSRPLVSGKTPEAILELVQQKMTVRGPIYELSDFVIDIKASDSVADVSSQILWKIQTI